MANNHYKWVNQRTQQTILAPPWHRPPRDAFDVSCLKGMEKIDCEWDLNRILLGLMRMLIYF